MDKNRFESLLVVIVPAVLKLIMENYTWNEIEASDHFYKSKVYEKLEKEETKMWHFSPLTLFNMFDEEQKTGDFTFPEEV